MGNEVRTIFEVGDVVEHVLYDGEHVLEEYGDEAKIRVLKIRTPDVTRSFDIYGKQFSGHDKPAIKLIRKGKKLKIERWINVYADGATTTHSSQRSAESIEDKIACEHFVKEYTL